MKAKPRICVSFLPNGETVSLSHDGDCSVLDLALRSGIQIDHTCGGNGTCGTCLVEVKQGLENLEPLNEIESEIAADRGFKVTERLSCQLKPVDDLVIQIKYKTDCCKSK